jgi:hypothetical protein
MGRFCKGEPYLADMGGGFKPYRRDMTWYQARDTAITPLLEQLELSAGKKNWGYQLRFGLFEITEHDWWVIHTSLNACWPCQRFAKSKASSPLDS